MSADLPTLAGIVSEHRTDIPACGLPLSLLSDLAEHIRCDVISFEGFDSAAEAGLFVQELPLPGDIKTDGVHWRHYWQCEPCSYPDRTGDLRTVIKIADFYSGRQWHSTGMYSDVYRPRGYEHELMLTLPFGPGPGPGPGTGPGPGKTARLFLFRGPGSDFAEEDRALLTLLRPHLLDAYQDAERRRSPAPALTPRQRQLADLLASGRTNRQIARDLGLSEGTVRTHLENIYRRLGVQSRTQAVIVITDPSAPSISPLT
jgi:DNA-binding CsgD family transcriptional regulator